MSLKVVVVLIAVSYAAVWVPLYAETAPDRVSDARETPQTAENDQRFTPDTAPPQEATSTGRFEQAYRDAALYPEATQIPPLKTRPIGTGISDAPHPLKFGALTLSPELRVQTMFDDNVHGTLERTRQYDFIAETLPSLDLVYRPTADFTLKAYYEGGWHEYLRDTARDFVSHNAAMSLQWDNVFVHGLSFSLSDQYTQTGNTEVLQNEFFAFTRVQGNNASPMVTYQNRRVKATLGYVYGFTDYMDVLHRIADFNMHRGFAQFAYRIDRFIPFVSYEFTDIEYPHVSGQNFQTHRIIGGTEARYGKMHFEFGTGLVQVDGPGRTRAGSSNRLRFDYYATPKLSLYALARREFVGEVLTGEGTETDFESGVNWRISSRAVFNASMLLFKTSRLNGTKESTFEGRVGLRYHIDRHLNGYFMYDRADRTTNFFSGEIKINRAQIGLEVHF